jgi:hypothetical protein
MHRVRTSLAGGDRLPEWNAVMSAVTHPTRLFSVTPARSRWGTGSWWPEPRPSRPAAGRPPAAPYDQARLCLDLIGEALGKAGSGLDRVIRTRMFLTDAGHWQEVARAHGEVFAEVKPAATAVIVAGLLDPAWLVEIEAEAAS